MTQQAVKNCESVVERRQAVVNSADTINYRDQAIANLQIATEELQKVQGHTAWEEMIWRAWPNLCRDYAGDPAVTPLSEGFVIPSGWYDLFQQCCAELADYDPNVVLVQVKEKFGSMSVYVRFNGITPCVSNSERLKNTHAIIDKYMGYSMITHP